MAPARQTALGAVLALTLVALNVFWVASALGPPPHRPRDVRELDHRHYIAMAGGATSAAAREAPFCYRVLAPALVRLATGAGLDLHLAFWLLMALAETLFLFVLFRSLAAAFPIRLAALGTLLAALMPGAVRWYAYQYWMPDPLCLFFVALGILLANERRTAALGIVGVLGLLTRESFVVAIVYALVRWARLEGLGAALRRGGLAFGPGLVAFAIVRAVVPVVAGPGLLEAAREMIGFRLRHLFDNQLYFATLGSFGVLVPLFLACAGHFRDWLRDHAEDAAVVATVYASLAFANNTDRLLVYALPALIPAALGACASLATRFGAPREHFVAVVVGLQAFVYWCTPFHGTPGLSVYQPVQWSVVAVLGAFAALCLVGPRVRRGA